VARQKLPAIEYTTSGGLVTKLNPLRVGANGMVRCQNADTFAEYGSLSKVPGSTRVSDPAPAGWESIHPFEHRSLSGELRRHVVGLAGTSLYKIQLDKTLTALANGLYAEPMTGVVANDRLYLTSPNNDPVKVDSGNLVTPWGVETPSERRLPIEAFDDATDWTPTDCTVTDATGLDSTDGAIAIAKTNTTVTQIIATKSSGFTGGSVRRYLNMLVLIPEGVLQLLSQGTGPFGAPIHVAVDIGLGFLNPEFDVAYGELVEGRNLLEFDLFFPGLSGLVVAGLEITINTTNASATFSDMRFDSFYTTPNGYPVVATGVSAGGIEGSVRYRVTYVSKFGQESNAGRISEAYDTGSGGASVQLTEIPVSPDLQVIARRIYRDQDGDAIFRFVTQIGDNVTMAYEDVDAFSALSLETCPLAGNSNNDFSRPQKMRQVVAWNGFLVGIDADVPAQANFTYKNRNEAWPISRRVLFDYTLTAIVPTVLGVFFFGKDRYTVLTGRDFGSFLFEEIGPEQSVGVSGWRAWAPFKALASGWHDVGPYVINGVNPWYMGNPIKDQIEAIDTALFEDLIAANDRLNFRKLYFTGTDHRTVFAWGYGRDPAQISGEGVGIDPLDLRRGAWKMLSFPESITPKCIAVVERPGDRPELWMGCSDGFVYWVGDPTAKDWAVGMGSEAIDCDVEWEWTEHPQGVEDVARFLDICIKSTVASVWEYTVSVAEQVEGVATFTTTGTIAVDGVVDAQISLPEGLKGEFVKLRLRNNRAGEDGTIRRANVQVIPRREQRRAA
jgi:hypothetical protein